MIAVTLDGNKGSGSSNPALDYTTVYIRYGGTEIYTTRTSTTEGSGQISITSEDVTREGYDYRGFSSNQTATAGDSSIIINENGGVNGTFTLFSADGTAENPNRIYAVWSAKSYTLTLDANSSYYQAEGSSGSATFPGGGTTTQITVTYDKTPNFTIPSWTDDDTSTEYYSFGGFYNVADPNGSNRQQIVSAQGGLLSVWGTNGLWTHDVDNETLYAHWVAQEISVTVSANGGQIEGSSTGTTTRNIKITRRIK